MSSVSQTNARHFWLGKRVNDEELAVALDGFETQIANVLTADTPNFLGVVLSAANSLAHHLRSPLSPQNRILVATLENSLKSSGQDISEAENLLKDLADFLAIQNLKVKVRRELGGVHGAEVRLVDTHSTAYEAWAPLGVLVHITPGNAPLVGVLSLMEGLVTGNVNLLKVSSADRGFSAMFAEILAAEDSTGWLANHIAVLEIPSSNAALLGKVVGCADGVAVWGGESAVTAIRKMAPDDVRLIAWGHRLSFAWVAAEHLSTAVRRAAVARDLAHEIVVYEQQACSSPQVIYVETTTLECLRDFADDLGRELDKLSAVKPLPAIAADSQAEITMTNLVQKCEASYGAGAVSESAQGQWRIFISESSTLQASPLYRSVWLKPLPTNKIISTLRPMRPWLQTAGIRCNSERLSAISQLFVSAGVLRITAIGQMTASYPGEPHDGVYALQQYSRRISYQLARGEVAVASFSELAAPEQAPWLTAGLQGTPTIVAKEDFQNKKVPVEYAHLFFKSGGSSGSPKFSVFTYEDYHEQMQAAADGLLAAGLDPQRHRCMNLFFGGGLYGGFLSFYTILEKLQAVQFPMAAHQDLSFVGDMILKFGVDTLLGMPSYLLQLFNHPENAARFMAIKPIKRVFYGGEHLGQLQRKNLSEKFGVETIRSATYGSVDSGPLGFQCSHCTGSIHHLHNRLQYLEVVAMDADRPVAKGEVGRLVFSSRVRHGQNLFRYDIGDLGRILVEAGDANSTCGCGRSGPIFELLGRHGDVFRAGGAFFNYQKICQSLEDGFGFSGEIQIEVSKDKAGLDRLVIYCSQVDVNQAEFVLASRFIDHLCADISEFNELVLMEKSLGLQVVFTQSDRLRRTAGSGKLIHILDQR